MWLDAGNSRSFIKENIWHDLSGNGNDFYLYNSPTISEKYVSFNGINQYAKSINKLDLSKYDSITVEAYFEITDSNNISILFEHTSSWNNNMGGFGLALNNNGYSLAQDLFHTNHTSQSGRNYFKVSDKKLNTHTNIFSKIQKTDGRLVYFNAEPLEFTSDGGYDTSTQTNANGQFTNDYMYIASRGGEGIFFKGNLVGLRIYGKALSQEEIGKNYELDKRNLNI